MAIDSGDSQLDALVDDLIKKMPKSNLLPTKQAPNAPVNTHGTTYKPSTEDSKSAEGLEFTGYQSPIKGTFYNSGDFSFTATDKRHPNGHMGVDMRAAAGTPIYPLAEGVVTNVGTDPKGGNVVNIQHPNGVRTYYAHCSTVKVHKGDKVDKDTIIATVGDTGNAKGTVPHLHFQVWTNGQIQNPNKFFTMPRYTAYDKKKEKWWASDEAKQEAEAFNMQQHVTQGKPATSLAKRIDKLFTESQIYYDLAVRGF
jgi:murein DD-endopeptidase MepM/ murein hydrolase activator NlpD